MKKIILLLVCIVLVACSSIIKIPDLADVEYCKTKYNDANLDDLDMGYKLYVKKCGGCHSMYSPKYYKNDEWEKLLPEMIERSKLNSVEELQVRKYIYTMNRSFPNGIPY